MTTYDVIVVGAGIEGSSTAYNLAKRDKKVLLLEQFTLPHNRGSSHGQSRITRYAYPDEFYVRMMVDAFPMWATLEKEYGKRIFIHCGVVDIRQEGAVGGQRVADALRTHNIPHEVISPEDFRSRYPMFKVKDNVGAVLDPSGGILKNDTAIRAFQTVFQRLGGTLRDGCPVTSVIPGDKVKVVTPDGIFTAENVVLATGPWTGKFAAALGLNIPMKPKKAIVYYWKATEGKESIHHYKNMPCFLNSSLGDGHYSSYGLPMAEYPGLVKVCIHEGPECDPDNRDQVDESPVLQQAMEEIRTMFPWLESKPSVKEDCITTNTPDYHPYIDSHPEHPNIFFAAAFSGHGFKLAPAIGKAVSELVLGLNPTYKTTAFRLDRFQRKAKM